MLWIFIELPQVSIVSYYDIVWVFFERLIIFINLKLKVLRGLAKTVIDCWKSFSTLYKDQTKLVFEFLKTITGKSLGKSLSMGHCFPTPPCRLINSVHYTGIKPYKRSSNKKWQKSLLLFKHKIVEHKRKKGLRFTI